MNKEGWTYKIFTDCMEKIPHPKQVKTDEYHPIGRYPVVSQEEKTIAGYSDLTEYVYQPPKPIIIFGDHTRVLKYVDFDFIVGADGVKILIPKDDLQTKFLYYYLKWYKIPNLGYSRHFKLLKEINVPVPPLSIQQRIVSELDQLSDIIAMKRKQVEEYDALTQSVFYEMFGDPIVNEKEWPTSTYGDSFSIGSGGTPSKTVKEYWENGTIPWIGSNMCQNTVLYKTDGKFITEEGLNNSSAKILQPGTILVALVGATIGKVALLECETAINQNIAFVKHDDTTDSYFLYYYTMGLYPMFQNVGNGKFKMANQKFVKELPVALPPLPLQHAFADKVRAIERQKQLVNDSIRELQTLLDSRMQEYFG